MFNPLPMQSEFAPTNGLKSGACMTRTVVCVTHATQTATQYCSCEKPSKRPHFVPQPGRIYTVLRAHTGRANA